MAQTLTKKCTKCKELKLLAFFRKRTDIKNGYTSHCISCLKKSTHTKEYRLKNALRQQKIRATFEGKKAALVSSRKSKSKYYLKHKQQLASDPIKRLATRLRALVRISLKLKGYSKKSKTYAILGCTFEEFKVHLESQFYGDMSWDNFSQWHLDHIIPMAAATSEAEAIRLNHYLNFQPLWAKDNLLKGSKLNATIPRY